MSLLMMTAAALYAAGGGGGGGGYDSITADWAGIDTDGSGPVANSPVTITFSTGATRTLQLSGSFSTKGTLMYYIDADPGVVITPGGTLTVASGEDVYFTYEGRGASDLAYTVTVTDITAGETVDTFPVTYDFTPL